MTYRHARTNQLSLLPHLAIDLQLFPEPKTVSLVCSILIQSREVLAS